MKNKFSFLILALLFLESCSNNNETQEQIDPVDSNTTSDTLEDTITPAQSDTYSTPGLWIYDYYTRNLTKNKDYNQDTLSPENLIRLLNSYYMNVHLDLVKLSHDTIFVRIKESSFLTQQMGSSGADDYISTTTFTLTELKGIKYVNFDFEEGDHASPGTYSKGYFVDRNKESER